MRLNFILLFLLILFFLGLSLPHLLEFTPVWPDEAVSADIASNILKTGQVKTGVWGNFLPEASQHVFWYPPLYFYLLASWFEFLGFSITSQRILSLFLSSLLIAVFYLFLKLIVRKELGSISEVKASMVAFLGVLLLIIDPIFFRSATLGRPETLVLTLIIGSATLLFYAFSLKVTVRRRIFAILSGGFMVGLSVLTHFLAVIFLLVLIIFIVLVYSKKFFLNKEFYLFLGVSSVPILIWLLIILPDTPILLSQLNLFYLDRSVSPRWLDLVFSQPETSLRMVLLVYATVGITILVISASTKKPHFYLVSLLLGASWLLTFLGKVEWYGLYITTASYIALFASTVYLFGIKKGLFKDLKFLMVIFMFILAITGLNNYLTVFSYSKDKSYLNFAESISLEIPKGKNVFISSFPDAYFAFNRENNRVYENPFIKSQEEDFEKILVKLDYVIINSPLPNIQLNDRLRKYLAEKASKPKRIDSGGYSVTVFEINSANR